jgi:hypothetical protein
LEPRTFLTREQILGIQDEQTRDVWIPEWKTNIRMRGLTSGQRDAYESSLLEGKGKNQKTNLANARAKLVVLCCLNSDGTRMFSNRDAEILADKAASAMERLFDAARELSGMTEEDMEELTGNSGTDQSDGSSSDSASPSGEHSLS